MPDLRSQSPNKGRRPAVPRNQRPSRCDSGRGIARAPQMADVAGLCDAANGHIIWDFDTSREFETAERVVPFGVE